jgi:hypothetical protein
MPIRVMSWNISRFNQVTLDRSDYNEMYILEAITAQQLDLVLLIEVTSTGGPLGSLINGPGKAGLLTLLASLRAEDPASDWRLIPPPRLNDNTLGPVYTEGLAILYRNHTLTFTGPYFFQGAGVVATGAGPGVAYPGSWAGALPGGIQRAPRITWARANGTPLNFPNAGNRPPMMATFLEPGVPRNIRFLAVHLPPNQGIAAQALPMINDIPQLLGGLVAPNVAIVAGDFNFDPFYMLLHGTLAEQAYWHNFYPPYDFRGLTNPAWVTRIENTNSASLDLVIAGLRRYQIVVNNGVQRLEHVDNAFVKYGGGAPPGAAYNPIVADMVAGTGPYPTTMSESIATILGQAHYPPTTVFRQDQNYGHVARWEGVSDHLPIVFDVP